ncbi:MAG: quinone oxidoreductase [Rhodospirillaceae bacterium]|nr:quinone oxidoreductase [Rhodospirillaceae bacterium]|tara:strand:- start:20531 stop:21505 length:975 start_codon:yes stop_codon:yes gene_type:complete
MVHAIRIHKAGPASVLKWQEVDIGNPRKGEVLIRNTAVGLNFIDTYHRKGLYPIPTPFTPGVEGAGVIEKIGAGVMGLKAGDRVAYCSDPIGSYAEKRLFPANRLIKISRGISDEQAASMMLKGLTASMLLKRIHKPAKGEKVLIHAAAGGVGLILCQWAKHLGATVIGTVSSRQKANLARANGCDHTINYAEKDFVQQVRRLTKGEGVPVVYDGVGKNTYPGSLDCLQSRGMWITFGNASGPVPPVAPLTLLQKGSLFMTRPMLNHYIETDDELRSLARELFSVVRKGAVNIQVNQRYKLKDAAKAHRDLEKRRTSGSTVLIP